MPRHAHGRARWRSRYRSAAQARKVRRSQRATWIGRHPKTVGAAIVVVAMTPVWWSLGNAMASANTLPPQVQFVEWVRGHGGGGFVRWVENIWYSHHQPPKGGRPPKGAIPAPVALKQAVTASAPPHLPTPAPITPLASPAIPGEGQWHPAGPTVGGVPTIYEAFLRPDPVHTSLVAGVAWMDPKLLRAQLYAGAVNPGVGGPWTPTAPIAGSAAQGLAAAFNAGFLMNSSEGGFYLDGKTGVPLRTGAASFVIYANGTATVGAWGTDVTMTPSVVSVRQNLSLLVNNGAAVAGLNKNDTTVWGATLGNQVYVWRSGVGVTANGAIVYVGGPGLNITTLATLLARAGAVRAMELDINTDWVNFFTFAPPAGQPAAPSNGTPLLTDMVRPVSRYFGTTNRDFFTMSVRQHPLSSTGPNAQPASRSGSGSGGTSPVSASSGSGSLSASGTRASRAG